MSEDREYDDLIRTERKAKRMLAAAHYRITIYPRCDNCEHFRAGTYNEDSAECARVNPKRRWSTGWVEATGICDEWTRAAPHGEAGKEES